METPPGEISNLGERRRSKDSISRILQVHLTPNFGTKF
jgi:hypothetical protein